MPACEASRLPTALLASSRLDWTPLWDADDSDEYLGALLADASMALDCRVSSSPFGVNEGVNEKYKKTKKTVQDQLLHDGGSCRGDFVDSMNVDDLSELLKHIQSHEEVEEEGEAEGRARRPRDGEGGDERVDFSIFIEDEDALNVEEISDVFSALEEIADLSPLASLDGLISNSASDAQTTQDVDDAQNVDAVVELFDLLEQANEAAAQADDASDAANVDDVSVLFASLDETSAADALAREDAANVDAMASLFSDLAEASEQRADAEAANAQQQPAQPQSWIKALNVDADIAGLLPEPVRKPAAVDSRIFVPQFAVRIEGRPAPSRVPFVAGPLSSNIPVYLAGPPVLHPSSALSREDRVERWKEKRKVRSFAPREPDAAVSDTRRACAAKRQRVKGRFTREKSAFVSITALQTSS